MHLYLFGKYNLNSITEMHHITYFDPRNFC